MFLLSAQNVGLLQCSLNRTPRQLATSGRSSLPYRTGKSSKRRQSTVPWRILANSTVTNSVISSEAVRNNGATPTSTLETSDAPSFSHVRKVAVIGAGIAGLQVGRALQKAGVVFTIFEAAEDVGGVWRSNYAGYGAQVRWPYYEFPEFEYPEEIRKAAGPNCVFPLGASIQEYIRAYARNFNLLEHLNFNAPLIRLQELPVGWEVVYGSKGGEAKESFDMVVIATGVFSKAAIPEGIQGLESFEGESYTAQDFTHLALARGKKVVVVGMGKSAVDVTAVVASVAAATTIVFRRAHWLLQPWIAGLPFEAVGYGRFALLHRAYYDCPAPGKFLHMLTTPVKWLIWRVVELSLRLQTRLPKVITPETPIELDCFYGGQKHKNQDFIQGVTSGKIQAKKGVEVASVERDGVVLSSGEKVAADVIVWATGHRKEYNYLAPEARARLGVEEDGLHLYRSILPTGLKDLAYIGSECTTYNNPLTSGLQAEWLASVIKGDVQLPSRADMDADMEKQKVWRRQFMPNDPERGGKYQLYANQYHDQLMRDMKERTFRKGWAWLGLAELFEPYKAADYRTFFQQRASTPQKGKPTPPPPSPTVPVPLSAAQGNGAATTRV